MKKVEHSQIQCTLATKKRVREYLDKIAEKSGKVLEYVLIDKIVNEYLDDNLKSESYI